MTVRAMLLGFTVPDAVADKLFAIDPAPAVQTHRFGWSLAGSLRAAFGDVRLLSSCPVQNYPLVPRLLFRRRTFEQKGIRGVMLGFVNLIILKHVTRFFGCLLMTWTILRQWRINTVFIHGVHTPYLAYGLILRRLGVRVIPVVTDLPGVILSADSALSRALKRVDRRIVRFFMSRANAIIALAPDLLDGDQSPAHALVIPGIINQDWLDQVEGARGAPASPRTRPTVLYAGGLHAAYGIDRLLDAARLLPEVEFLLLGKGDQVPRIIREARPNISYEGFVPPSALVGHLLAADILINPRPSGLAFARASFPSKLLEYAATGRPVLTTRIASIPEAIAGCFDYIDDESPEGIAYAINALLSRPAAVRNAEAQARRKTIVAEFSEAAMAGRLSAMLA